MNIYGNEGYKSSYNSFFFYGSFREALEALDDVDLRNEVLWSIIRCGTENQIPNDVSPAAKAIVMTISPLIDNARKRYEQKVQNHIAYKNRQEAKKGD